MTKGADLKILVVGPLPPPYTGTTTLLQYLVEHLEKDPGVEVHAINTLGVRGKGLAGLRRFFWLGWTCLTLARKCDVVTMHCSTTGLHVMGLTSLLVARVAGKPLLIRKFAGDDYRTTLGPVGRRVAEFALRHATMYLAESNLLVNEARDRGISPVVWYPNSRPIPELAAREDTGPCRRFVYIGRVIEGKGMRVLAEAARKLPESLIVDVYGPWGDDLEKTLFDDCPNVSYKGALKPEDIVPTMRHYDASLLPTHYRGEGYPGAVLESYIAGLPVVATRWRALPEIIDDSVGLLVEPKNAGDLAEAMIRMYEDEPYYQRLCENTASKAAFFSAERWGNEFVALCRRLKLLNEEA